MKISALFSQMLCLLISNLLITSCNNESTFNLEPSPKEKGIISRSLESEKKLHDKKKQKKS
jgi:hypothetical protein